MCGNTVATHCSSRGYPSPLKANHTFFVKKRERKSSSSFLIDSVFTPVKMTLPDGQRWHHASIRGIITNLTYTGVLRSGESRSQVIPELRIISPEQYERAQ